jgi:hypothetical protein
VCISNIPTVNIAKYRDNLLDVDICIQTSLPSYYSRNEQLRSLGIQEEIMAGKADRQERIPENRKVRKR